MAFQKLYAPIEVPNKTVEFIYTLRISGKKDNQKNDGNLIDKSFYQSYKNKYVRTFRCGIQTVVDLVSPAK